MGHRTVPSDVMYMHIFMIVLVHAVSNVHVRNTHGLRRVSAHSVDLRGTARTYDLEIYCM